MLTLLNSGYAEPEEIASAFNCSFGEVLTVHVGDPLLAEKGDDGPDDRFIFDRDMAWLSACDALAAEMTAPSLGVGYELGCAVALKKPVLCLYRPVSWKSALACGGLTPL
jgi:2'-deoxynucleoside 5'-phosphate N-hydrolase